MLNQNKKISVDSPEYNKKVTNKFVLIMILSLVAGMVIGGVLITVWNVFKGDFSALGAFLVQKFPYFQAYIMPWLFLTFTIVCTVIGFINIKKAKRMIDSWDGEDDDHIAIADKILSNVTGISNIMMIGSQILFGLTTYQLVNLFSQLEGKGSLFFFNIAIYLIDLILSVYLQNAVVTLVKKYAPEKKGNVMDMKFQDVYYKSLDEAERQIVGDASYQTMTFMSKVFSPMMLCSTILGMFLPIGLLCTFFIGLCWLIMSMYYVHICKKLEHGN